MFNARVNNPTHAAVLLSMFHQLYDIEGRANSVSAADRQGLRQEDAKPIWERMREHIHGDAVQDVLPKDSFGQALTYLRNQFDPLLVYLDDGLMPIDNNETEQLMKQVAIGWKNWLFIGDIEPGYRAADRLPRVSSAEKNTSMSSCTSRMCSISSWPVSPTITRFGRMSGRSPIPKRCACTGLRNGPPGPMPRRPKGARRSAGRK